MGKPEFKSPRPKGVLTLRSRPLTKGRSAQLRTGSNVKVVVRVRPPNTKEQGDNSRQVVEIVDDQILIFDPKTNKNAFFYHGVEQKRRDLLQKANKNLQCMFDKVFGFTSKNKEVFENTTKDLIECLMDGYNCSVFAYGATGAGKTHTMLGHNDNPGITFLTMAELFKAKENLLHEREFELGISYIEVYNEQVQDLLNPGPPLQLRDDGRYGVMVSGIKIAKIENPEELFELLARGNSNRTQHPTDANAESSRSHAVFQVYIQMKFKVSREVRAAKLSMIDLAGSERGSATGYGGARFAEGANINKSLLALGNCINSLADGQKYIPYRDSKLTRLLKDSLGGNCQTVMVANVSPSSLSYEDTYNTLKYAMRAKKITSDVKKNVVNIERHVGEYVKIVEDLKKELDKLKSQMRENKIDPKIEAQLNKLIEERRKIFERMHHIELTENMLIMRRQLKEETDSRLSWLLTEQGGKEEAHRRLGNSVGRFHRQEDTLNGELAEMKLTKLDLENKIEGLVKKHPELQNLVKAEEERFQKLETKYQLAIYQRKLMLFEEEHKSTIELLGKIAMEYKSYHLQLRGHGLLSASSSEKYRDLESHIQGRKNITWDSSIDSGLSSMTTSSTDVNIEPIVTPNKRKNDENINSMNDTYVMEAPPKPKVKVCAEVIAKVYTTPNAIKKKKDAIKCIKEKRIISATRVRNGVEKKLPEKKRLPFRT